MQSKNKRNTGGKSWYTNSNPTPGSKPKKLKRETSSYTHTDSEVSVKEKKFAYESVEYSDNNNKKPENMKIRNMASQKKLSFIKYEVANKKSSNTTKDTCCYSQVKCESNKLDFIKNEFDNYIKQDSNSPLFLWKQETNIKSSNLSAQNEPLHLSLNESYKNKKKTPPSSYTDDNNDPTNVEVELPKPMSETPVNESMPVVCSIVEETFIEYKIFLMDDDVFNLDI